MKIWDRFPTETTGSEESLQCQRQGTDTNTDYINHNSTQYYEKVSAVAEAWLWSCLRSFQFLC